MHGLAGAVAVDPALHGRPRDLESGGDLTDRPALLDDELDNLQTVTRCEGSVWMGHGIFRSGTAPRHPPLSGQMLHVDAQCVRGELRGFWAAEGLVEVGVGFVEVGHASQHCGGSFGIAGVGGCSWDVSEPGHMVGSVRLSNW